MNHQDSTLYRVNLICACKQDLAYGYGPTLEAADAEARRAFRRHNGRAKVAERIVEHAVSSPNGGSHYEEVKENGLA